MSKSTKKVKRLTTESFYEGKHKTFYDKWQISHDVSLRFHYVFEDRPNLQNKFILKIHSTGNYTVVDNEFANSLIDTKLPKKSIKGFLYGNQYYKIIDGVLHAEKNIDKIKEYIFETTSSHRIDYWYQMVPLDIKKVIDDIVPYSKDYSVQEYFESQHNNIYKLIEFGLNAVNIQFYTKISLLKGDFIYHFTKSIKTFSKNDVNSTFRLVRKDTYRALLDELSSKKNVSSVESEFSYLTLHRIVNHKSAHYPFLSKEKHLQAAIQKIKKIKKDK